jgi:LacI family gluconate utilization system Gnt-I transcriptional repressor
MDKKNDLHGSKKARRGTEPVTLSEIAALANVSAITVSRVIRNKGPISEKTRKRVNDAIARFGYVPNRLAGSLASAASDLIGVVIPSLSNIVFADVLRGINQTASRHGFRTLVTVTDYRQDEEERLVTSLLSWRPVALIVTGLDHMPATRRKLKNTNVAVVEIMDTDGAPVNVSVGFSHREAGTRSAGYLLEQGYRRIGYVGHDLTRDLRARKRYKAFLQTLEQAGISIQAEILTNEGSNVSGGRAATAQILKQRPNIEAIYYSNDDMAIGGYFHCISANIRPREDLALMGFNGLDIGQALPQPLTTILTHRTLVGEMAARLAIDSISGQPVTQKNDVGFSIITGSTA